MYVLAKPMNGGLVRDCNGSGVLPYKGDVALDAIRAADLSRPQSFSGGFG